MNPERAAALVQSAILRPSRFSGASARFRRTARSIGRADAPTVSHQDGSDSVTRPGALLRSFARFSWLRRCVLLFATTWSILILGYKGLNIGKSLTSEGRT